MFRKLPVEFDADRYRAAYPDVRLSGLTPQQHYLQFGRHLGRSPSGRIAGALEAGRPRVPGTAEAREAVNRASDVGSTEPQRRSRSEAIIDRPEGFDPLAGVPTPAPPRAGSRPDGKISLGDLAAGPFADASAAAAIAASLDDYAKLLSDDPPSLGQAGTAEPDRSLFREGPTRIENAWFAGPMTVRLMIGDGASAPSTASGWILRAYQAAAEEPGQLRAAGEGMRFPDQGPVFVDIELTNPLFPIILELEDSESLMRAIALWPFPSLLPGGLHAAELKALQQESNPMDAFWSLSDTLLRETIGEAGWPARSVQEIAFHGAAEGENPLARLAGFEPWFKAVFGLSAEQKRSGKGASKLLLPANSVPTISALASRRLDVAGNGVRTGPLLVTSAEKARPRWSVAPPPGWADLETFPALEHVGRKSQSSSASSPVPIHLAIAHRVPGESDPRDRASQTIDGRLEPMTVLVLTTDEKRTGETIEFLREAVGSDDLKVRASSRVEYLGKIAREARNDNILTISDRVRFDRATLHTLLRMLRDHDDVGSASCVLLGERVIRKEKASQPAFGGIFAAGVSFSSSPRLSFKEPDLLEALPASTYPVIANTFNFTLWNRAALLRLPDVDGPIPPQVADIRLGLDLMEIGYRSLCTTTVSAAIDGPYLRRDVIDPVGAAYLQPQRWEHILGNVTNLRELF